MVHINRSIHALCCRLDEIDNSVMNKKIKQLRMLWASSKAAATTVPSLLANARAMLKMSPKVSHDGGDGFDYDP